MLSWSLSSKGMCDFRRVKLTRVKCWLLILSMQRDTDIDIWQVYGGRICGVMQGESVKNTDALVHGSVLSDT